MIKHKFLSTLFEWVTDGWDQSIERNVEPGKWVHWFKLLYPISTKRQICQSQSQNGRGSNSMSGDWKD